MVDVARMDIERLVQLNTQINDRSVSPEDKKRAWEEFLELTDSEHSPSYKGISMDDSYSCSCGWESNIFWDGSDFAMHEWRRHILNEYGCLEGDDLEKYERQERMHSFFGLGR